MTTAAVRGLELLNEIMFSVGEKKYMILVMWIHRHVAWHVLVWCISVRLLLSWQSSDACLTDDCNGREKMVQSLRIQNTSYWLAFKSWNYLGLTWEEALWISLDKKFVTQTISDGRWRVNGICTSIIIASRTVLQPSKVL